MIGNRKKINSQRPVQQIIRNKSCFDKRKKRKNDEITLKYSQKAFQQKFAAIAFFGRNPCRKKAGLGEENLRREREMMSFVKAVTFF